MSNLGGGEIGNFSDAAFEFTTFKTVADARAILPEATETLSGGVPVPYVESDALVSTDLSQGTAFPDDLSFSFNAAVFLPESTDFTPRNIQASLTPTAGEATVSHVAASANDPASASTSSAETDLSLAAPLVETPPAEHSDLATTAVPVETMSAVTDSENITSAKGDAQVAFRSEGGKLENLVSSSMSTEQQASNVDLPYGLFGFNVTDVKTGGIAKVTLTLPEGARPDSYFKQDLKTGEFSRFNFDGETGAVIHGNEVTLYFRDGGRGDDDGVANGVVVDPGGPGAGSPNDSASDLVISQVYGSGGATGASYNRDFIELYNRGSSTITLTGKSVQYADTSGSSWQVMSLSGTIAPGRYHLIGGATGSSGASLPTVNLSSTVNVAATGGKVALVNGTTALMGALPATTNMLDRVGYGDGEWFEGSGAAPANDVTKATMRIGAGNYDSDDNIGDFTAAPATPRNSSSAVANRRPTVAVATDRSTAMNTAVTVAGVSIADPDAGASPVQVSVSGSSGVISLSSISGLTFSAGDGTSDATMTFTGTVTATNTALNNLVFTPTTNFLGAGFVTVSVNDQGNTGSGGPLYGINSSHVVVGGPVLALDDSATTNEDTALVLDFLANDDWVTGSAAPSVTITTAPSHGSVVYSSTTGSWTYTPTAEYNGTDSFVYLLNDGQGHTDPATVSLTITSVNDARIQSTSEPNMYADEGVAVNVRFATPDATSPLTWSATGLPAGMSLNASTGYMTGKPEYSEAGNHAVTLTATAANGDTNQIAFNWLVNDKNRISWMDDQFSQEGESANFPIVITDTIGTPSIAFTGLPSGMTSLNGTVPGAVAGTYNVTVTATRNGTSDTRTFVWTIYPAATIIYSGTPVAGEIAFALAGSYYHFDDLGIVGKHLSSSFKPFLTQLDYGTPSNNTLKVMLVVTQGAATLTADPNATSGSSSIILYPNNRALTPFDIIPTAASTANDDVIIKAYREINNGTGLVWAELPKQGKENAVESFEFGTAENADGSPNVAEKNKIYTSTTPAAMLAAGKYRITPRADTSTWVKMTGTLGDKSIWLVMEGYSVTNGWGEIAQTTDGTTFSYVQRPKIELKSSNFNAAGVAKLKIRGLVDKNGVYQTVPTSNGAYVGKLKLILYRTFGDGVLTDPILTSEGFSVAAIPVEIEMKLLGRASLRSWPLAPETHYQFFWGAKYQVITHSDSTKLEDLKEILMSEWVVPKGSIVGGFDTPDKKTEHIDYNGITNGALSKIKPNNVRATEAEARNNTVNTLQLAFNADPTLPYTDIKYQRFVFLDKRTASTAIDPLLARKEDAFPVSKSGFKITKGFVKYSVSVTKIPYSDTTNTPGVSAGTMAAADQAEVVDIIRSE